MASDVVLSYEELIVSGTRALLNGEGLSIEHASVTLLLPLFEGHASAARLRWPAAAPLSPIYHAQRNAKGFSRALAFALDILLFAWLALHFAKAGARGARRRWFAAWLFGLVIPSLALENVATNACKDTFCAWALAAPVLPAVALLVMGIVSIWPRRAAGRNA